MQTEDEIKLKLRVYEEILADTIHFILTEDGKKSIQDRIELLRWVLKAECDEMVLKTLKTILKEKPATEDKPKTIKRQAKIDRKRMIKKNDKAGIINFIKKKDHTIQEIQEEFKFPTRSTVYYWIAQAGLKISDIPKKSKKGLAESLKEKPDPIKLDVEPEDWEDANEFAEE